MTTTPARDDYHNALAWLTATYNEDHEGRNALAATLDPVGLVDAMTAMLLGLARVSTGGHPGAYLDHLHKHLDRLLDEWEANQ